MNAFMSAHRSTIVASVAALLLGWAVFVSPRGSWPGLFSSVALIALVVTSTAVLMIGQRVRESEVSLMQIIRDAEAEPRSVGSADR